MISVSVAGAHKQESTARPAAGFILAFCNFFRASTLGRWRGGGVCFAAGGLRRAVAGCHEQVLWLCPALFFQRVVLRRAL
ncbi:hypothetical protein M440DRAFT_1184091 [Trichoderma longibrachiatum ATCC 18648]|uniref:Uncharacterized protein n=1 Tax=Trichoderma longibrachiatum ATCC 18648 TaxID=983965 RepID=A0A2T4C922_TRILO|nr:hypothetical protein M440DRAFT_1184091 [Trichoderma longibrachiatum ATCC 18648]